MTWAEAQGYSPPPHVRPNRRTAVLPKARNAPIKSIALSFIFQSPVTFRRGMKNSTHRVVIAVSGRFRRKIHLHESSLMEDKAPPMTGPIPLAIATTAPKMPWYLPLSRSGTTSLTIIWATVINPPPPTPVKARKTISWVAVCESDAASDPMKKMPSPTKRTSLRDHMSERRPYMSWKQVEVLLVISISQGYP
ncbi:unnamed protein product [Aspergillus oryzae]|nr:unnamed protein product [Aspergillus oryzae]